jgi:hypothetical protein
MDTMEDTTHQGRAFLGMADQARHCRGVCVTPGSVPTHTNQLVDYPAHPCGLLLLFRTLMGSRT